MISGVLPLVLSLLAISSVNGLVESNVTDREVSKCVLCIRVWEGATANFEQYERKLPQNTSITAKTTCARICNQPFFMCTHDEEGDFKKTYPILQKRQNRFYRRTFVLNVDC